MNAHSPTHETAANRRDAKARTASPPGRRTARSADVRHRLLGAAATLVAERQSTAITARDIARAAGVSDGVLYNHFEDKHDLILAALVERFERVAAEFRADVSATTNPSVRSPEAPGGVNEGASLEARLGQLAAASLRLHASALPMLANVLSEPALFHRFMVAIHAPGLGPHVFMDPIEALVRAERDAGRTGDVEPAAAADLLVGSILLLALVELLGRQPRAETEARLRHAVHALVVGLAPRSRAG